MSVDQGLPEDLIWATRGRSWGFRFLLGAGRPDPLLDYQRVFGETADDPSMWVAHQSEVGLRLVDPEGRYDASGRPIPHEFVLFGSLAAEVRSVDDGRRVVWPLVASAYARVWGLDRPPSNDDLR